jgi:hypothetical protein
VGSRLGSVGFGAARLASKIFFALRGLFERLPIYIVWCFSAAYEPEQIDSSPLPNQCGELGDLGRF